MKIIYNHFFIYNQFVIKNYFYCVYIFFYISEYFWPQAYWYSTDLCATTLRKNECSCFHVSLLKFTRMFGRLVLEGSATRPKLILTTQRDDYKATAYRCFRRLLSHSLHPRVEFWVVCRIQSARDYCAQFRPNHTCWTSTSTKINKYNNIIINLYSDRLLTPDVWIIFQ